MEKITNSAELDLDRNDTQENWWDYCPICSSKLVSQKCKFVCPNPGCNFFMSCSEFDL